MALIRHFRTVMLSKRVFYICQKPRCLPDVVPAVETVGIRDVDPVQSDDDLGVVWVPYGILVGGGVTVYKRSYLHVQQIQSVHRGSVRSCKIK